MKIGIISPRVLIRRALSTLLASTGSAFVVVEGSTIRENLDEIKRSLADTLIVDLCGRWDVDGLSELNRLAGVRILVLMDDLESDACVRALRLGAWGCLSTKQSPLVFQKTLIAVARGERWLPELAANRIIEGFLEKATPVPTTADKLMPGEWEVLRLLASGFRNKEISDFLSISEETAKSHIRSIYRKLNIRGRREAILRYFEHVHQSTREEVVDDSAAGPLASMSPGKS